MILSAAFLMREQLTKTGLDSHTSTRVPDRTSQEYENPTWIPLTFSENRPDGVPGIAAPYCLPRFCND
jgi:hypothetical protein